MNSQTKLDKDPKFHTHIAERTSTFLL